MSKERIVNSVEARIHCHKCNTDFIVYFRKKDGMDTLIECPHCSATMDEHMSRSVCEAMGTVQDLNQHFRKYHEERNEDLFSVSIDCVNVPYEAYD